MTAILQPTVSNHFNTTPGPATCRLEEPFSFPQHTPDLDSSSLTTIIHERSRQPSPASIFSVASAPPLWNNENLSPLSRLRHGSFKGRSVSAASPKTSKHITFGDSVRSPRPSYRRAPPIADKKNQDLEEDDDETAWSDDIEVDGDAVVVAGSGLHEPLPRPIHPFTPAPSPRSTQNELGIQTEEYQKVNNQRIKVVTPNSGLLSCVREMRQHSSSKESALTRILPTSSQRSTHQQKISDDSSGFIHSMRTASVTNASFSIVHRSSRFGRSTDSYKLRGSQPRYSIDSDRPLSSTSFDDAALRRGFKRQQIIDELIMTEEGYVSDLKALVYLYSTLLASTSSIPNNVRAAIERNVTGILHTHEGLLARFHDARLRAAARRWADTEVPARLGNQKKSHSQRVEGDAGFRHHLPRRRVRSSIDSAEAFGPHPRHSGSAEPIDVFEITSILKTVMKSFHAYEEYCANFEIIRHELQKHNPQLWPTYESGIESLARVIMAIDQRQTNDRRGLTVSDLLIKPIQRLTKYPLLLEQLLNNTPVADAPSTHVELEIVLQSVRDIVQMVNLARENPYTRQQIQRKWLLQDRLNLSSLGIAPEQFRSLGSVELCGILHIAYQTSVTISGCYALCVLFDEHFLIALPVGATGKFEAIALIQLSDIKIETPIDGKGLQCTSTLFTWKLSFACDRHYHELILSGCSKIEEDCWIAGLRENFSDPVRDGIEAGFSVTTRMAFDLRSVGVVFSSQTSLSRESSVQRAATVGGRPSISHVVVRNTHNVQDLHECRDSTSSISSINRSQSHVNTKRIPVLEPRRSERTRLETSISDIWTRDRLPFPGMVGSKGGQIIRASAGSLARKLSLASLHTPFSKGRTSSLSIASKKSYDLFNDTKPTFEIRRREHETDHNVRSKPKDIPEVDDMRSVVDRMIGGSLPIPNTIVNSGEMMASKSRSKQLRKTSIRSLGPHDPAAAFYEASASMPSSAGDMTGSADTMSIVGIEGPRRRKKRWSKHWPIDKLKEFGSEARGIFHSGSSGS